MNTLLAVAAAGLTGWFIGEVRGYLAGRRDERAVQERPFRHLAPVPELPEQLTLHEGGDRFFQELGQPRGMG